MKDAEMLNNMPEARKALLEKWKNGNRTINEIHKRIIKNKLPLSFAQQRIWFLEQLVPDTSVYNIPGAVHLKGALDVDALNKAINKILERHEALRTQFIVVDANPVQEIVTLKPFSVQVVDLRHLPEGNRKKEAFRIMEKEARTPMKITEAPLVRTMLLQLDNKEHYFFMSMHHIISDGWSLAVFQREFTELYDTYMRGEPAELKELSIQYGDFSEWHRYKFEKGGFDSQLAYWVNKLEGVKADLPLSFDRPRPSIPNYKGARHHFEIPAKLVNILKEISSDTGATLYMILLSALNVLLYRYSGQSDLTVGCPIANRNRHQIEDLIGFFVNTLVIRSNIEGDNSFLEVVRNIKKVTLESYENQDIPFERVVEAMHPNRNLSASSPLFQTGFVFQNTPFIETNLKGLTLTPINIFNGMSIFELLLSLTELDGKLEGFFEYSDSLFDAATIERMESHFITLIQSISENPDTPVKNLKILTQNESEKILEWGKAKDNFPVNMCIHERVERVARAFPEKIALTFNSEAITYCQLNTYANKLANKIIKLGVSNGSLVGVYMDHSIEMVVSILAVLKAGGAYVPINTIYPEQRIRYIAEDARMCLILTQKHLCGKLTELGVDLLTVDLQEIIEGHEKMDNITGIVSVDDIAYVIYTSGSTGKPKGVLVEHKNVVRLFDATEEWFNFNKKDVWTLFHSHAFDFSVWEIWGALFYGGRLVIVPYMVSRSPEAFHDLLCMEEVTVLNQTPSAFRQLVQVDERKNADSLKSLRYIIFGGEALDFHSLKPWFDRHDERTPQLVNMYGITETTVHVTYRKLSKADIESGKSQLGIPIPDLSVYLLDKNKELVPVGLPGEIYVGGAGVARGYLERPELTKERFITDPFDLGSGLRLYKSGDMARLTPNGDMEFLGRSDNQVKIRGFRLELGEIEALLKQHESIRDAIVTLRPDASGNKQLIAYVKEKEEEDSSNKIKHDSEVASQWKQVFNQIYSKGLGTETPQFNITGWESLYDAAPISAEQMYEWLDSTVKQILDKKPSSILEIGCGTGLLLFRLAQNCEKYFGTDISETSIAYLKEYTSDLKNVNLLCQPADDIDRIGEKFFDIIVINSVIQYFPSVEYLVNVLKKISNMVGKGGSIFIGDVRSLPLLETFYNSVEVFQAGRQLTSEELKKRVRQRIQNEHELIIDPLFFYALKKLCPRITNVEIRLKKGKYHNELTRFRYDVMLEFDNEESKIDSYEDEWVNIASVEKVRSILAENRYDAITIKDISNERLRGFMDGISEESIDPVKFFELESESGYCVQALWAQPNHEGSYYVLFKKNGVKNVVTTEKYDCLPMDWQAYANRPYRASSLYKYNPELRSFLGEKLPDYMIPVACLLVSEFPLTPNGKIDLGALPIPGKERPELENPFVEPATHLEKQISEIWSMVLGINKVGVNDSFFDLGGHSLLATQLIFKLRDTLGVDIPLRVLFETPTIRWIASTIVSMGKSDSRLNSGLNLREEVSLNYNIGKTYLNKISVSEAKNILLTGATGFLGAYLLRDIAEKSPANIHCLVRGADDKDAFERLRHNLEYYGVWNSDLYKRIKILNGDLGKPLLGLSENKFERLSQEIDIIYHNGSKVNFIAPYIEHKPANVNGTLEIIGLAQRNHIKELHYVSTTHVFTDLDTQNGILYEDDKPDHPEALALGYTQSKWVAETILSKAAKAGLPVYIYRPGRIWGDSVSGNCQHNDFLWLIIKTSIQTGMIPELDAEVDVIPVDFASSAIIELSKRNAPYGMAYNLVNPSRIKWEELIGHLEHIGYRFKRFPMNAWKERIIHDSRQSEDNAAQVLIPLFNEGWESGTEKNIMVNCDNMMSGLDNTSIKCPQINADLIKKYISYFIKIGFINAPL